MEHVADPLLSIGEFLYEYYSRPSECLCLCGMKCSIPSIRFTTRDKAKRLHRPVSQNTVNVAHSSRIALWPLPPSVSAESSPPRTYRLCLSLSRTAVQATAQRPPTSYPGKSMSPVVCAARTAPCADRPEHCSARPVCAPMCRRAPLP